MVVSRLPTQRHEAQPACRQEIRNEGIAGDASAEQRYGVIQKPSPEAGGESDRGTRAFERAADT